MAAGMSQSSIPGAHDFEVAIRRHRELEALCTQPQIMLKEEAQRKFESSVSPSVMAELTKQTSPVKQLLMEMYEKALLGELVEK